MKVGDAVRFHQDEGCEYEAHILSIDAETVPPLLTVEVHYDTCVVITTTTVDDANVIPLHPPTSGKELFHRLVRWGLGIHGFIHVAEMAANLYEGAWISAGLSFLSGGLMLAGAFIDWTHHKAIPNRLPTSTSAED